MRDRVLQFGIFTLPPLPPLLLLVLLTGCAGSLPRAIEGVQTGMDKDRVLEIAGNPQRTFRESMQDHWVYVYFTDDREMQREVIFDEGKVVRVGRPIAKEEWQGDLDKAKTMEEFEQKAREHQKNSGSFKSVDGEPDEAKEK